MSHHHECDWRLIFAFSGTVQGFTVWCLRKDIPQVVLDAAIAIFQYYDGDVLKDSRQIIDSDTLSLEELTAWVEKMNKVLRDAAGV